MQLSLPVDRKSRCRIACLVWCWLLTLTSPVVGQSEKSETLTLKRAKALERQLVFAEKGLHAYQHLLAHARMSNQERDLTEERIAYLLPLAANGTLMIGGQPKTLAELEAMHAASEKLVEEALVLAANGPNEKAQKNLEQAQKDDPVSFRAHFLLGLYNAAVNHDYFLAEADFKQCVERARYYRPLNGPVGEANLVGALNNWAISKFRADRLDEAIRIWEELVEIRPRPTAPILRNICKAAYYVNLAKSNPREWPIKASTSMVKRYESLASKVGGDSWQELRGGPWTLSGYLTLGSLGTSLEPSGGGAGNGGAGNGGSRSRRLGLGSESQADDSITINGMGTGVIVHSGYVLTSYNVVMEGAKSAQRISIRDGTG